MAKLEPQDLYELDADRPDLTGAVLLHALDGFVDAGAATSLARNHLLSTEKSPSGKPRVLARFDVDLLYDYRARRPIMQFDRDRWESIDAPELVLHLLHDDDETPFLLLTGPEPDVQWELFAAAIASIVDQLGVRISVGLTAFPMGVPHTRPTRVVLHASRPGLVAGHDAWMGRILVPASAGHLVEFRLGESGHDALGIAAPVPSYLAANEYPAAAAALLREVNARAGLALDTAALDAAAERTRAAVDAQVADNDEVRTVVAALEEQHDAFIRGQDTSLLAQDTPLPTADELGAELEQFLAEQARGGDTGTQ